MNTPILSSPEISRFRASAPLREGLKTDLESTSFAAAMEAVLACALPTGFPDPMPGVHYDTVTSHDTHRRYGIYQAFATIKAMAAAPGKHALEQVPEVDAFTTNLPPEFADPLPPSERKK